MLKKSSNKISASVLRHNILRGLDRSSNTLSKQVATSIVYNEALLCMNAMFRIYSVLYSENTSVLRYSNGSDSTVIYVLSKHSLNFHFAINKCSALAKIQLF